MDDEVLDDSAADSPRFLPETVEPVSVPCERGGSTLMAYVATKLFVARPIDLAMPPRQS